MRKKVIGLLLATTILWGSLIAHATDTVVENSTTSSTPTRFTVTSDMLQNNVIVSVPAEMVLNYNASTKKLTDTDYVSARGDIKSGKHLEVSVPTSITYRSSNSNVNGVITFGTGGTEKWTPSQVSVSNNNRYITSTVDAYDLDSVGNYSATINFNISIVND